MPVFLGLLFMGLKGWALSCFCVAGVTDLIDGTVARIFKQTSAEGALIDPMADKLLLNSAFVSLAVLNILPVWFVILAFGRDLMIVSGIFYLKRIRARLLYGATYPSKFATLLQLATAVIGLILVWKTADEFLPALRFLTYLTAVFLIISGFQYVLIGLKLRKERTQ